MLVDLPTEILQGILALLEIRDLLVMARTGKRFRELVEYWVQQGHIPLRAPFSSEEQPATQFQYQRFPWILARLKPPRLLLRDGTFLDHLPTSAFFPRATLAETFPPLRTFQATHPKYVLGAYRNRTTLQRPPARLWAYLEGSGTQEMYHFILEGWDLADAPFVFKEKHSRRYPLETLSLCGCNLPPYLLLDFLAHHGRDLRHLYLADCWIPPSTPSVAAAQAAIASILLQPQISGTLRTLWLDPCTFRFPNGRLDAIISRCQNLHELRLGRLNGENPWDVIQLATQATRDLKILRLLTNRHAFTIFPTGRTPLWGFCLMVLEDWFRFLGALQDHFTSLSTLHLGMLSLPAAHALMRALTPTEQFAFGPLDHLGIFGINQVSEMPGVEDVREWGRYMAQSSVRTITLTDLPWLDEVLLRQWAKDLIKVPSTLRHLRLFGTSVLPEKIQSSFWSTLPVQVIICDADPIKN
ncbi:hypothetical protein BJ684DRAFT_21375 [Piptocephalis cylindrospora]|uniref:F-box domain-containing protein n=1 Tax=Piptocephalis cylindrospora TaxID=1907219 RepID=A0A4P9Y2I9_9FUNG|nr:hypothetical protein BJ684DRAFT_21375 [Piptocephalis cylindrospora]|eukprot:RKP12060.1 hypothetical protein BJ684DRAFT_21375 [Piptocephalis cylindrospora]